MPSNDKDITEQQKSMVKASQAITLLTEVADYCYDNKIVNDSCTGCGGCCGSQK